MSSIRGLLVTEYTDFNNLEINEIPRVNLGPKQVRIRVKAAGVSFSTKLVVEGNIDFRLNACYEFRPIFVNPVVLQLGKNIQVF